MVAGVKRDGTTGAKPYTPTTRDNTVGHMDLVVKDYPEGNISRHICSLKVGDEIKIKGPFTKRAMNANEKKEIGMIVGGWPHSCTPGESWHTPCLIHPPA